MADILEFLARILLGTARVVLGLIEVLATLGDVLSLFERRRPARDAQKPEPPAEGTPPAA